MISDHDFIRDEKNQQIFPGFSTDFACLCRRAEAEQVVGRVVPWHHHPAIEINYVVDGSITLRTADQEFTAQKGDAIFVNSDMLHTTTWDDINGGTVLCLVFDAIFLSGMYGNVYERKYLRPITECKGLQGFLIHPDCETHMNMSLSLLRIFSLFQDEPFGYEFEVRSELSRLWCCLFQETEALRHNLGSASSSSSRMKPMLEFIHTHYKDKVLLDEIADAGSVSRRECTRCFQRYTNLSPIDYLNFYRVRMAIHELLQTDNSIADIAADCGFHSSSYFGKIFQREMGCTPGEYRKSRLAQK